MSALRNDRFKSFSLKSRTLETFRRRQFLVDPRDFTTVLFWTPTEELEIIALDDVTSMFIIRRVSSVPCQEIRAKEI
jgi:hypothetical protein